MRALVAGGAGFIGSHLCECLLAQGWEVICLDNLLTGRPVNIEGLEGNDGFSFVHHDLTSPLLPELPRADWIFQLASPASPIGYQRYPLETMRVNSEGTLKLLELAEHWGATFLFASTSEAYGDPLEHPQREEHYGNVNPIGPRSMYDESKRYGEALTSLFHRGHRVDTRIVRIFNTYGPRSDPKDGRVVPNFITQALEGRPITVYGEGTQTRSLCYVSDLVSGLVRTMVCETARGEVINLGYPQEHTVLELAEIVRELCCSQSEIISRPTLVGDDPRRRRPDISKARTLLGWRPEVSLEAGLRRTIGYFEQELRPATRTVLWRE
jgi:nucleoside-diphosphate-sugar epimerase